MICNASCVSADRFLTAENSQNLLRVYTYALPGWGEEGYDSSNLMNAQ